MLDYCYHYSINIYINQNIKETRLKGTQKGKMCVLTVVNNEQT